ncbi:MAG: hypothetical protein IJ528_09565 [Bacteroidaceae bacterium]|nr:hypothetical protein [Bacteroidaceae bacterium]
MNDKVRIALQEAGLDESDLTKDELKQLEEEIECEAQGGIVLDGILFNQDIQLRHMRNNAIKIMYL